MNKREKDTDTTIVGNKMIIFELQHKNYILTAQELPEISRFKVHSFKNMISLIKNKFSDEQLSTLRQEVQRQTNTIKPVVIEKALAQKYGRQVAILYRNMQRGTD